MTTLYDVIVEYILPLFGDFTLYEGEALHAFHTCFCLLVTFVVLYMTIWVPFKFIRWLAGLRRNK